MDDLAEQEREEMERRERQAQEDYHREREEQDAREILEAHSIPKERVRLHGIIEEHESMKTSYWYGLVQWAWKENLGL